MAYIAPDTELQFFQNVGVDPDYENTIYFPTTVAKDTYFDNLPSIKCPSCYYQREMRGFCRVEVPIRQMLDRTYMRFKNKQFENKWFYAFIDDVEYINNITTQVNYTLDVMMTWMGGYTLDECFVERNHTETDAIGDNIVPEAFGTDLVVNSTYVKSGLFDSWAFLAVFEPDSTNLTPSNNDFGYPTALHYSIFQNLTDITSLPALLTARLLGIYYVPTAFLPEVSAIPPALEDVVDGNGDAPVTHTNRVYGPIAGQTDLDGYIPTNNKLYTYPYYYLSVENTEGEKKDYLFELTRTNYIDFEFRGVVGELTQVALIPKGYNTPAFDTQNNLPNYSEKMEMTDFPMCGWTIDTYQAFLAQQLVSLPSTIYEVGAGALATGGVGAASGAASALVDVVEGSIKSAIRPFASKGRDTPQLGLAVGEEFKDFFFYKKSVRAYKAKIIDDFFTMYGYAINEVKQPLINARPYYTYVKTVGCHINGSLPASDRRTIENIFNQGVRFWDGAAMAANPLVVKIGNYDLDNTPATP